MGCCSSCCNSPSDEIVTYAGDERTPEELEEAGWSGRKLNELSRWPAFITDLPYCVLFALFCIGFVVVSAIAFEKGNPSTLVFGRDYQGNLCGQGDAPAGWAASITACKAQGKCIFQNADWSKNKNIWSPLPFTGHVEKTTMDGTPLVGTGSPLYPTYTYAQYYWTIFSSKASLSADVAVKASMCVETCPKFFGGTHSGAFTNAATLANATAAMERVTAYGVGSNFAVTSSPWYYVWYNTEPVYRRCLLEGDTSYMHEFFKDHADDLPGEYGVDSFVHDALADFEEAWKVLAICGACALIFPLIYALIVRCCICPMVWFSIITAQVGLCVGCAFGVYTWDEKYHDNHSTNDGEAIGWLIGGIVCGIAALIFFLVIVCSCKQIAVAIACIEEGTKVLASDLTLYLVPIFTAIGVLSIIGYCIVVCLYIYTIEDDSNLTNVSNGLASFTVQYTEEETSTTNMMYYTVFGYFWMVGVASGVGYFVIAGVTVQWYYSHRGDDKSLTCAVSWCRAYCWAFVHIGGIAAGALIVAIVKFVRFLFRRFCYFTQGCEFIKCLIECCLECLERCLEWITHNTYIVMAIEGCGFWCGICRCVGIMIDNIAIVSMATCISGLIFFFGKLAIAGGTGVICWLCLREKELAGEADATLIFILLVSFAAYILAGIFIQVFSVAVDAMIILCCRELTLISENKISWDDAAMGDSLFRALTGCDRDDDTSGKKEAHLEDMRQRRAKREGAGEESANEPAND